MEALTCGSGEEDARWRPETVLGHGSCLRRPLPCSPSSKECQSLAVSFPEVHQRGLGAKGGGWTQAVVHLRVLVGPGGGLPGFEQFYGEELCAVNMWNEGEAIRGHDLCSALFQMARAQSTHSWPSPLPNQTRSSTPLTLCSTPSRGMSLRSSAGSLGSSPRDGGSLRCNSCQSRRKA